MKIAVGLLATAGALALAACNTTAPPVPSGGSAGAEGPGYCDSPPAEPEALSDWEELCQDQGPR